MKKLIGFAVVLCLAGSLNAYAKNVWDMADSDKYGEKAAGMFGRGLLNAATCPIDMPVQAVSGAQKQKPEFVGAIGGFATGAACTVLRAASGIIDVATFWVPSFHGVPVSRGYENCLDVSLGKTAEESIAPQTYTPPDYPYTPAPVQAYEPPAPSQDNRLKYIKK